MDSAAIIEAVEKKTAVAASLPLDHWTELSPLRRSSWLLRRGLLDLRLAASTDFDLIAEFCQKYRQADLELPPLERKPECLPTKKRSKKAGGRKARAWHRLFVANKESRPEAQLELQAASVPQNDELQIPDSVEPILAWRCWDLGPALTLRSMNGTEWPAGRPLQMDCLEHGRPSWDCSCGVYAANLDDPGIALQYMRTGYIFGLIKMWGQVVEGYTGYRAEFAEPLVFLVPSQWDYETDLGNLNPVEVAFGLQERYHVPARVARSLSESSLHKAARRIKAITG